AGWDFVFFEGTVLGAVGPELLFESNRDTPGLSGKPPSPPEGGRGDGGEGAPPTPLPRGRGRGAPRTDSQAIHLAIENEGEGLYFRENLRMLSHASGLRLQVIARVNLQEPRIVSPFAVAPVEGDTSNNEPRLEIPPSFAGRICLGFDEIQRP